MSATRTRISADQFVAGGYPRDSELVDGELVVSDPTFEHQEIALRIVRSVAAWVDAGEGRGRAGYGGNWVLAEGHVYKPDAWWISEELRAQVVGSRSDVAPTLAVEVRSPGTWHVDVGPKRVQYERGGVRELWLVDSPARTVLVLRRSTPGAAGFDVSLEAGPGALLTTPLLAGFTLPVDALFD